MRSHHGPDDSVETPPLPTEVDECAAKNLTRSIARLADGEGSVFCFECEAQPDPALSVSGSLLNLAPAERPRKSTQRPLSRLEAKEATRRHRLRSFAKQLVSPVAFRNSGTRIYRFAFAALSGSVAVTTRRVSGSGPLTTGQTEVVAAASRQTR